MDIVLKRAFDSPEPTDGYRVLVDRIWPRGIAKAQASIDEWRKDVAPSDKLRQAFHNGELSWGEFRRRYLAELRTCRESLRDLAERAGQQRVTLVYASRDERHNNAVVLKQYLQMLNR
ncbi:DUF488 domain-containing protein [Halomonas cerina]|uniref:Uncharacterized protein YeaO (DUF488 family) n=1 Tax=Halomonas cerina TaxID=447424 RepID=A0A839V8L9_9GAMM|nr:DUF488 family protein [Halomonas cerina]MBB3190330.1 uncharacterized protein YeaO (DUF488 family) [Halomonas cerina]